MAIVADASAVLFAVLGHSDERRALRTRLAGEACHAPHLLDAELGNGLRRRVRREELPADDAERLLLAGAALVDRRYGMTPHLGRRAWALRENLSFYDALYVALAFSLSLPLVTADARLARAPRLPCEVELVGVDG